MHSILRSGLLPVGVIRNWYCVRYRHWTSHRSQATTRNDNSTRRGRASRR